MGFNGGYGIAILFGMESFFLPGHKFLKVWVAFVVGSFGVFERHVAMVM